VPFSTPYLPVQCSVHCRWLFRGNDSHEVLLVTARVRRGCGRGAIGNAGVLPDASRGSVTCPPSSRIAVGSYDSLGVLVTGLG
jgi:hypothetical protein